MSPEYFQAVCRCRRNWVCPFCRKWLATDPTQGTTGRRPDVDQGRGKRK